MASSLASESTTSSAGGSIITGGAGNDGLLGTNGNDTMDGGGGSDALNAGAGNDTMIYLLGANAGATDIYVGGSGVDTLSLQLTQSEWSDAGVRAQLSRYISFLSNVNLNSKGELGNGGANNFVFSFPNGATLVVQTIEKLAVSVQNASGQYVLIDPLAALITGPIEGSVTEAGGVGNATPGAPSATGNLYADDLDGPDDSFIAVAAGAATANHYGTYELTAAGVWTYTLDNSVEAVDSLVAGATLTDNFTVQAADGTTQVVTVFITGTNDNASITGDASGSVSEAGGVGNAEAGTSDASGSLNVSDVDAGQAVFQTPASLDGTYGSFTFDASTGAWAYTLDDARAATQALAAGEVVHDHLTVTSSDGTASQAIDVTVNGASDVVAIPSQLSGLDGTNGFRLNGAAAFDASGLSVSEAGDVNGDGFGDVIVGAYGADPNGGFSGTSYVVFGRASGFGAAINLSSLDGSNGFLLNGEAFGDFSGRSVSAAGDVNGDGFGDLIVGAVQADSYAGASYVVFGRASDPSNLVSAINLSSLDGSNGFRLNGVLSGDSSGRSVNAAGDVNGDGFADLIVGADQANSRAGASYVVFGKASGFASEMNLSSLDGSNGFRLNGQAANDFSGISVSAAGDVNGDGFGDLIVGAYQANDVNGLSTGASYVVFGKASSFDPEIQLSSLDGSNGFRLNGAARGEHSGHSVSAAGDVNGDGFADLIVGADAANSSAGASYVVFGKASGFGSALNLSSLDGSNGFRLNGVAASDSSGHSVSAAGDVNGDGFADLIVGADGANSQAGASYVVFGKASGFGAEINLSSLDGSNGFQLNGAAGDRSGFSVSSAGDVNGDGFADLIVGAYTADPNGDNSGSSFVVFGGNFTGGVTFLGSSADNALNAGTAAAERFVAGNGNDTMAGGGGADVFHGGEGDDRIAVSDLTFQLADGGSGIDTLALSGSGITLNLASQRGHLSGIEAIDLTGGGNNTLNLTALDLLNLSDTSNTLTVEGNVGDALDAGTGWTNGGSVDGYNLYTQGQAVLLVGVDVSITIA
ncbi:MAG: hypothetical protein K0Q43_434 [Ramlibacter sp.]|jgi:VCBS repeat-containing protein|nr:hypothetical protein [Ramlibacter sp.]